MLFITWMNTPDLYLSAQIHCKCTHIEKHWVAKRYIAILYDAIDVKFEHLEKYYYIFLWISAFILKLEATAALHPGREGRGGGRWQLQEVFNWLKIYFLSLFYFLTKRYKANISKSQNVFNLDYGHMVFSFIFFSAHFWMYHIFHKDKNLKNVFLLSLRSLVCDKL